MAPAKKRRCKDCPAGSTRAAPHPGPRCATHHREVRLRRREAAWERHIWETYRLTAEAYWAIYAAQSGCCALCRRGKGIRKRLCVDHDHSCCATTPTCGQCTRGLLDTACNKLLGHFRDSAETFLRAADYLTNPPAREIIQCEAS